MVNTSVLHPVVSGRLAWLMQPGGLADAASLNSRGQCTHLLNVNIFMFTKCANQYEVSGDLNATSSIAHSYKLVESKHAPPLKPPVLPAVLVLRIKFDRNLRGTLGDLNHRPVSLCFAMNNSIAFLHPRHQFAPRCCLFHD